MPELEPLSILLVEDDPADHKLIRASLKEQRLANDLHIVSSGEEGIDFLQRRGDYSGSAAQTRPYLAGPQHAGDGREGVPETDQG